MTVALEIAVQDAAGARAAIAAGADRLELCQALGRRRTHAVDRAGRDGGRRRRRGRVNVLVRPARVASSTTRRDRLVAADIHAAPPGAAVSSSAR
jgi:copper homeostasis protein